MLSAKDLVRPVPMSEAPSRVAGTRSGAEYMYMEMVPAMPL